MDNNMINPADRLIFALDVGDRYQAERFVDQLQGIVSFFKVGIILHTVTGPDFILWLLKKGKKVFLDLKFFDIQDTVRDATKQVAGLGVHFLTVHAEEEVMTGAIEGKGSSGLKVLAVTLLTNLVSTCPDAESGRDSKTEDIVVQKARMAQQAGCDGIVTSGLEIKAIKRKVNRHLLVVTPGVRPAGASTNGHKRIVTPFEAITAGADYIVVGRPIRNATDPRQAASKIVKEITEALGSIGAT